ncbi:MAG: FKBP-type peptidyl-prolyl cis-trans isomerase [Ferruginibacter sp.]
MKKWFFLFLGLPLFFASCTKADSNTCSYTVSNIIVPSAEAAAMQNYITVNSISAEDTLGIFYSITDPGTGAVAAVCSNITVNYTGSLLSNGAVFDSNTTIAGVSFVLGQLIVGWQRAIPLIRSGGSITIYIPPSLAYGPYDKTDGNGNVVIPANSYLKFTIHLLDVQ